MLEDVCLCVCYITALHHCYAVDQGCENTDGEGLFPIELTLFGAINAQPKHSDRCCSEGRGVFILRVVLLGACWPL